MGNEESHTSQSSDDESPSNLKLTKIQIRQTRNLWKQATARGNFEPGRSILLAILARAPEVEKIFNFGQKGQLGALDLQTHAKRFNGEIDFMITHLDDIAAATDHFQNLGRRHIAFQKSGFTTKLWDTFADCMIEKTVEWGSRTQRNLSSQEAWGKIILFLIDAMKTGYYEAVRAQRKNTISNTSQVNVSMGEEVRTNFSELQLNGKA